MAHVVPRELLACYRPNTMFATRLRFSWPFCVAVACMLVSAVLSRSFFHLDEHYMTLEFAGVKLGRLTASGAPLEYGLKMRSWLLPALYTVLIRVMESMGLQNPFWQATLLRLGHGVLAMAATVALARHTVGENPWRRSWIWLYAFVPYLAVRTSAENLSGVLLAFAVLAGERGLEKRRVQDFCLSGVLFGLAFEVRYQVLFVVLGYALSVALRRASPSPKHLASLLVGGLSALALGACCNRWGYGSWEPPLCAYYTQNIVRGMADSFGREPWFAFAYLPLANLCAVSALVCMASAIFYVVKNPKTALSGPLMVGVLGQSVFAHKEERFLFPLLPFAVAASAWTLAQLAPRISAAWHTSSTALRCAAAPVAALLFALNLIPLLALTLLPVNWRGSVRTMEYVYNAQNAFGTRPVRIVDAAPNNVWHMRFYANPVWTRWKGERLHCPPTERTLVLVNPMQLRLPDTDANCTYTLGMTELELATPWVSRDTVERFAHAWPGKPLPTIDWQAVYELKPIAP